MNFKLGIIVAGCVLLSCCKNSTVIDDASKYIRDDKIFSGYLSRQFHAKIAEDSTNYILVSENGCPGCITKPINALQNSKKSKIILTETLYQKLQNEYKCKVTSHYVIDSSGEINDLKYHHGNVCIIQAYKSKIYNIIAEADKADLISLK